MTVKVRHNLIAHELGHAIFSYLYDTDSYPTDMQLHSDGNTMACVNFVEDENLPYADARIAKIPANSYLGGLFGELAWNGRFRVMGIRADMDEILTELRYVKNGKQRNGDQRYRRSRSALFPELWSWFYTDRDAWSYGGCMKRWMECPRGTTGTVMTESRFRKRLPELAKIYDRFLEQIDHDQFKAAVHDIRSTGKNKLPGRTLRKYGRRIIPDTVLHPGDI